MSLIVTKFGGTSLGSIERIVKVAERLVGIHRLGFHVLAVVSAMASETDRLKGLAEKICPEPNDREYDLIIASGEQVSCGLLSMAVQSLGVRAISFSGRQIPIYTDGNYKCAKIVKIQTEKITKALQANQIVILAGFQGLSPQDELTTLGRGGSDITAVAVAAAMKANLCLIYTDVEGIFAADPNLFPNALHLPNLSYTQAIQMACHGAQVLHPRAVALAQKYQVPIEVLSSFSTLSKNVTLEDFLYGDPNAKKTAIGSEVSYKSTRNACGDTTQITSIVSTPAIFVQECSINECDVIKKNKKCLLRDNRELLVEALEFNPKTNKYSFWVCGKSENTMGISSSAACIIESNLTAIFIFGEHLQDPKIISSVLNIAKAGKIKIKSWFLGNQKLGLLISENACGATAKKDTFFIKQLVQYFFP